MDKHAHRANQHALFTRLLDAYNVIATDLDNEGPLPIEYIDRVGRKIYLGTLLFEVGYRDAHPSIWWKTVWSIRKEMVEMGYDQEPGNG